ncbi:DUF3846 domain-containing protein [Streptomyces bohaiensis]|uniref:DUF3846 domain-containing protein n=1 Tax=Streptomyces bohaiensis TaxID=1431344 RepID=A0ABX1C7I5_9ACTN|nr:DUF3846 domain-containing protein [Streptomyces bohaiensis]NJQ13540.1 DUF3846 domain-containing protein [Streptomyces bohaiensis]
MSAVTITPAIVVIDDVPEGIGTLEWLQSAVGGYVQAVSLGTDRVLWIGEDGKHCQPLHPMATLLARRLEAIDPADWIAGVAVITGTTPDGSTAPLTGEQLHQTTRDLVHALKAKAATAS